MSLLLLLVYVGNVHDKSYNHISNIHFNDLQCFSETLCSVLPS